MMSTHRVVISMLARLDPGYGALCLLLLGGLPVPALAMSSQELAREALDSRTGCRDAYCFSARSNELPADLGSLLRRGCSVDVARLVKQDAPNSTLVADLPCWKGGFEYLSKNPEPADPLDGKERHRIGLVLGMCAAIPMDTELLDEGGRAARAACYRQSLPSLGEAWNSFDRSRLPLLRVLEAACQPRSVDTSGIRQYSPVACFEKGLNYLLRPAQIPASRRAMRVVALDLLLNSCEFRVASSQTAGYDAKSGCFEVGAKALPADFDLRALIKGCEMPRYNERPRRSAHCFEEGLGFLVRYPQPRRTERALAYTTGLLLTAFGKHPLLTEGPDEVKYSDSRRVTVLWREDLMKKVVSEIVSRDTLVELLKESGSEATEISLEAMERFQETYMPLLNLSHTCRNSTPTRDCYYGGVQELHRRLTSAAF